VALAPSTTNQKTLPAPIAIVAASISRHAPAVAAAGHRKAQQASEEQRIEHHQVEPVAP
jgi:hypothetical protein